MIRVLGWPLLVTRRNIARLTLLDKMATKHVLIAYCSLLLPYPYYTKSTPAGAYAYAPWIRCITRSISLPSLTL